MSELIHQQADYGYHPKTKQSYIIGFITSLILTCCAFGIVSLRFFTETNTYIAISILAIMQLIVQSICFLRLNTTPTGRWNLFPFLFVLMIIAFLVGGSMWIMYHLNYNMGT